MNRFILLLILLLQVVLPVTVALLHSVTLRNIYRQSPETTSQKERNKRMMSPETVLKVRRLDSSVSTKATVSNSDSSFTSTASDDEASDFDTKSLQRTLVSLKINKRIRTKCLNVLSHGIQSNLHRTYCDCSPTHR